LKALEDALTRSNDTLMRRKKKQRLILDVDSTEDPAHDKQENVAFNGHFGKNCFHPIFAFTSDGDCLAAKLRPGNVHSADGVLDLLDPIVKRYRSRFILFWLRGDAALIRQEYGNWGRWTRCGSVATPFSGSNSVGYRFFGMKQPEFRASRNNSGLNIRKPLCTFSSPCSSKPLRID
jgi:Transposase DDE domain group 1